MKTGKDIAWRRGEAIIVLLTLSAVSFMVLLSGTGEAAGVLYVGSGSTHLTIRSAIENATQGDTIVIGAGTYEESLSTGILDLDIKGNGSQSVIIRPSGGQTSQITGSGTSISGITFVNHTLTIIGRNMSISDCRFSTINGTALSIEGSQQIDCSVLTFTGTPGTCISIDNSSFVTLDRSSSPGDEGRFVHANNVNDLKMSSLDLQIPMGSTGISASGFTISLMDSSIDSEGLARGVELFGSSLAVSNSTFSTDGVSLNLTGSQVLLKDCTFDLDGIDDIGALVHFSDNVTLANSSFILSGGSLGMHLLDVRDASVANVTAGLIGEGTSLSYGTRLIRTRFADITSVGRDAGITLRIEGSSVGGVDLPGCRDLIVERSSFNMRGDNTGIISASDHSDLWVRENLFIVQGNGTVALAAGPGKDCRIEDSSFSMEGFGSMGVIDLGKGTTLKSSTFIMDGGSLTGAVLEGEGGNVDDSTFVSFGNGSLIMLGGEYNIVKNGYLYSNDDGTGIRVLPGCRNASVIDTAIQQLGPMSVGVESGPVLDRDITLDLVSTNIVAWTGAGPSIRSLTPIRIGMDVVYIISNSSQPAIQLMDSELVMEHSFIQSSGTSMELGRCVADLNSSTISGLAVVRGGDLFMRDTTIDTTGKDLELSSSCYVDATDSYVDDLQVDATSLALFHNTIGILLLDSGSGPVPGAEVSVTNSEGTILYSTPAFGGADPTTDEKGRIPPRKMLYEAYQGLSAPNIVLTTARIRVPGTAADWNGTHIIDTSKPQTFTVRLPDIDLPRTPEGVNVIALETEERLQVRWSSNADDTVAYRVYSFESGEWDMVSEVAVPATYWTSEVLGPMVRGVYRVSSFDGTWESPSSAPVFNVTKDLTPPDLPSSITLRALDRNTIRISWTPPTASDVVGIIIEMNSTASMTQFSPLVTLDGGSDTYTINALSPGTTYGFRIRCYDDAENFSPYSPVYRSTTAQRTYAIFVAIMYDGGPLDGEPASSAIVRMISFNGSVVMALETGPDGLVTFTDVAIGGTYSFEASPDPELRGEEGRITGYLENASGFMDVGGEEDQILIGIHLPYHSRPTTGSISVSVTLGPPRSTVAYNALVELLDTDRNVLENRTTDKLGNVRFTFAALPFSGMFMVHPPTSLAAVPGEKSGYLARMTNEFTVTQDQPDWGTFQVQLEYRTYEMPSEDLLISYRSPLPGSEITDMGTPIRISFNQPVRTATVQAYVSIDPVPKGIVFEWSNGNQTLTISHDGLARGKLYRISIGGLPLSESGTTFPANYTENTWEFRTEKDTTVGGLPDGALWIIVAILIIAGGGIGYYLYSRQPKDDLDENEEYDPYSYDYLDEEVYDEGSEEEVAEGTEEVAEEEHEEEEEAVEESETSEEPGIEDTALEEEEVRPTDQDMVPEEGISDDDDMTDMLEEDGIEPPETMDRTDKGTIHGNAAPVRKARKRIVKGI